MLVQAHDHAAPLASPPTPGFFARHRWSVRLGIGATTLAAVGGGLGIWTWRDYRSLATNITLGTAGAVALGAVVVFLEDGPNAAEHTRITFVPSPTGASVIGRF